MELSAVQYAVVLHNVIEYVRSHMGKNDASHDFEHVNRVARLSLKIAEESPVRVNKHVVELAAFLHDARDYKYREQMDIEEVLTISGCPQEWIQEILYIVEHVGFSKSFCPLPRPSTELDIVQDADSLDAMGAIGIARCLTYGAAKSRRLYDPKVEPRSGLSEEEYKFGEQTTMNHFPEKLLLLRDRMRTIAGRRMAQARHDVMVDFVHCFHNEWKGADVH